MSGIILDEFKLNFNSRIDSYYLVDAALISSVRLTEAIGRTRARGAGLLATHNITTQDRVAMGALIDRVYELSVAYSTSLNKAMDANRDRERRLADPAKANLALTKSVIDLAQEQVIKPDQITYSGINYVAKYTGTIDSQFKMNDLAMEELEKLLNAQVTSLTNTNFMPLGGILVLSLILSLLSFMIVRSVTVPIKKAIEVAKGIASGDLSANIEVKSKEETRQLVAALKDMNESLERIVGQVWVGTDTIFTASSQITQGNLDLSTRTETQATSLEETASSMEELTNTVKQSAENARQANQLAQSVLEVAIRGGTVVSQVVETMGSINASAKKIADIISMIDGIAFQTNILALNAAVEAARAGEQGRGFAVVASEVRNLAQRSAAAAKEIKTLINDSVNKVESGSKLVDQAGTTMQEIVESVARVTDMISEISAGTHEQTSGIDQINWAASQMDEMTQQNASLVEEAAAASESLQEQARKLAQSGSVFKLKGTHATTALAAPTPHVPHVQHAPPAETRNAARQKPEAPPSLSKSQQPKAANKPGAPLPPPPKRTSKVPNGMGDDWEQF